MKYFYYLCLASLFPTFSCFDIPNNKNLVLFYPRDQVMERLLARLARRNDQQQPNVQNAYIKRKRNNAELVNHILKNLNDVDILGDVGR
uniref:Uncharacterized protein n=1 Tax=Onchocerca volvulus TaxID=6282 RepID=A0A8R1TRZ2_ONCVO